MHAVGPDRPPNSLRPPGSTGKKNREHVFLQAYEPGVESVQPLLAYVSFYSGQTKVFETPPVKVADALGSRLKILPLKFSFALDKLPQGEYTCQVTVLDPKSSKAAFWQGGVMLIE
jgi:hypothetical protein